MPTKRLLISWIGHADLMAMAKDRPPEEAERLLELARLSREKKYGEPPGPLKTALACAAFDEVHLLSNYPPEVNRAFARWLGHSPKVHAFTLVNPSDYAQVLDAESQALADVTDRPAREPVELCILLSPGTPTMAAVWILLGKTRYPATFYQTHQGKLVEAVIPFNLAEDVLPQLLRQPDVHLQHLAAHSPREVEGFQDIVGDSKALRLAVGRAQCAAIREVPVLIVGESGTGKEMFANSIHKASPRKHGPFVPVNCAAIPRELLEATLFGYKKGAFTNAIRDSAGAFHSADGGTLFLDEIGECDPALQTRLLRVLQPPAGKGSCHLEFSRVGEVATTTSNVRLIAATNRNLIEAIDQGQFREDLYYRLASITLRLPPLRERKDDITLLAEALLTTINRDFRAQEPGYRDKSLSSTTISFLRGYTWPGNVRQLHNALVQAAVLGGRDVIQPADLAEALAEVPGQKRLDLFTQPLGDGFDLERFLEGIQAQYLQRAMEEAGGVKKRAADLLGYRNYQTLDAQLKRLRVKVPTPRKPGRT